MEEQRISFKTAKLAKEKGFDLETSYFYTKPNSKMFGIDEKGRAYHIKNTAKKIYMCGEEATLNIENVYVAPTQSLLQKWLREKYDILVETQFDTVSFGYRIFNPFKTTDYFTEWKYETWEFGEALEEALYQALLLLPDKK